MNLLGIILRFMLYYIRMHDLNVYALILNLIIRLDNYFCLGSHNHLIVNTHTFIYP